jgi:hypothetical protein
MRKLKYTLQIAIAQCLILIISSPINAQVYEKIIEWDFGPEGSINTVTACAVKSNGNSLVAFRKITSIGEGAAALAEINSNGDTLWVKQFKRSSTYGECFIKIIKELPNNQLLLVGGSYSSSQYYHASFWKTDLEGNISTYKRMDFNNFREITINDIDIDEDGSIYFGGNYYDFLSAGVSFYNWTVPLFGKFNPDLTLAWAKTFGSTQHTSSNNNIGDVKSIKLTNDGSLMVYGFTGRHGQNNPGSVQIFKVDLLGQTIWNRQKPLTSFGAARQMVVSESGAFYTCEKIGNFAPPFGPTEFTTLIEKWDTDGNVLWSNAYGTVEIDQVNSLGIDEVNNLIYLCGYSTRPDTETDGLLAVIDTSGALVFCKTYNADSYDYFVDVVKIGTNYLLAGYINAIGGWLVQTNSEGNTECLASDLILESEFYPTEYTAGISTINISFTYIDYEPEYLNGAFDITTSCYACSDQEYIQVVETCEPYLFANNLLTESGIYLDTYTSSQGCDSIIALNLTVISALSTVSESGFTLTADLNDVDYQWVDCNNDYAEIPGETNQSFEGWQNGSYAVVTNNGNCQDTSACVIISVTDLEVTDNKNPIQVFPNPTEGQITINSNERIESIFIYNALGQNLLKISKIQSFNTEFNLPEEAGIFFIQVNTTFHTTNTKIVKY